MRNSVIRILSTLLLLFVALAPAAADNLSLADSAYNKGEYSAAIELYGKVMQSEGTSAPLYFNMGNAYSKSGDYGHAMLCYLRALRLNPSLSEADNNVKYIEGKVQDNNKAELKGKKLSITPDDPSFFSSVKRFISRGTTSDIWAIWAAVCFVLFCIAVALYIFTRKVLWRKIGFFGGMACFGLSVIFVACAFSAAASMSEHDEGVVIGYKVNLKKDPSGTSADVATPLTRGTLLDVLATHPADGEAEWYKVRLNSDFVGWISAQDLEMVNPD